MIFFIYLLRIDQIQSFTKLGIMEVHTKSSIGIQKKILQSMICVEVVGKCTGFPMFECTRQTDRIVNLLNAKHSLLLLDVLFIKTISYI